MLKYQKFANSSSQYTEITQLGKAIFGQKWHEQKFHQYIVPAAMIHVIMTRAHGNSGHNGFRHTYNSVKRHYFWRGMKKNILNYCEHCAKFE